MYPVARLFVNTRGTLFHLFVDSVLLWRVIFCRNFPDSDSIRTPIDESSRSHSHGRAWSTWVKRVSFVVHALITRVITSSRK